MLVAWPLCPRSAEVDGSELGVFGASEREKGKNRAKRGGRMGVIIAEIEWQGSSPAQARLNGWGPVFIPHIPGL